MCPALRVAPAETRLTVYRRVDIRELLQLVGKIRGSATIGSLFERIHMF